MTHARTLPRYVGAAGLVAGLLVAFPSLSYAQAAPDFTPNDLRVSIRDLRSTTPLVDPGNPSALSEFKAQARFSIHDTPNRRALGGTAIYKTAEVAIPRQTVRTGALAALSRGVMHPGFQVALIAAGYVVSNHEIFSYEYDNVDFDDIVIYGSIPSSSATGSVSTNCGGWPSYTGSLAGAISHCSGILKTNNNWNFSGVQFTNSASGYFHYTDRLGGGRAHGFIIVSSSHQLGEEIVSLQNGEAPLVAVDLNTHDFSNVDQYLPDVLVREIYQADTYPEPWYESLDVSSLPLSQVASPNGQAAPEVFEAGARLLENTLAELNGQTLPHSDPNVAPGGNTAQDEMLERWDEPVPDFAEATPEWQVETIDELPAFDIGIGSGQCPPPTVVNLPFPFNTTIELSWQPICDFASMIRGAVIAVAMILSLYIVLRRV